MKAANKKGLLYEPNTLTGIRNSLQIVLSKRRTSLDLRGGAEFANPGYFLQSPYF